MTTRKEGMIYAGLCLDFFLSKSVVVTPSFSLGCYFDPSGDPQLGSPLEFRSNIEMAALSPRGDRIGVQYFHISNGGIGNSNPGADSVALFYAIAF
jgi:lipid A 3-O-deacylase